MIILIEHFFPPKLRKTNGSTYTFGLLVYASLHGHKFIFVEV